MAEQGTILSISRRNAQLLTADYRVLKAKVSSKVRELTVGDRIEFQRSEDKIIVSSVLERANCLSRTYRGRTKEIAANLDRLFIVTAVSPLFNTVFVDRVLAVCHLRDIPAQLIVNKLDLGKTETQNLIDTYSALNIPVLELSAQTGAGMDQLRNILSNSELRCTALAGISGVGKSTILNALIPEASQRTGHVSHKTGQGRQTTSLSEGYLYTERSGAPLIIIDLPGVQNFGVTQLDKTEVAQGFKEIKEIGAHCQYLDCFHLAEPVCAVKAALESGEIAPSRYESYVLMLDEIESAREY